MIFERSIWPIIGSIFHPVYMMVNAKILGSIENPSNCLSHTGTAPDECITPATYLAAFGLASSLLGIVFISVGSCFVISLNNVLP
jgi:hypothetical protein